MYDFDMYIKNSFFSLRGYLMYGHKVPITKLVPPRNVDILMIVKRMSAIIPIYIFCKNF